MGARVYSYLRFSDPRQAAGSSVDRQLEYARRWSAESGLPLDESLSLRDEGLSAYHQRHVQRGALGIFLVAVEEGRIPEGSVLIVEGLDRLSRAEPIQAQAQLAQIINAGITVVTASDGREYNRERLREQPMDLVYSLLVMIRAHEESDTKSKRVRSAVRRLCEAWQAGTYRGAIRVGKDPAWVRWDGERWQLIPERVEAVRAAVDLFRRGYGATRIMRELEARGLRLTVRGTAASQLYRTIRLPALVGTKRVTVQGEQFDLGGYYPPVIDEAAFAELQALAGERKRRSGKSEIPGIITGLGICRCGYCGSSMSGQNLLNRKRRPDGLPQEGHRRAICVRTSHEQGCPVPGSCSVVPIERALMDYCADQMNLSSLFSGGNQGEHLRSRLAKARGRQAEVEGQIARVTEALLDSDGPAPITFARKARELEAELDGIKQEVEGLERELAAVSRQDAPAMAEAWVELVDGVMRLDYDARVRARQLVADTFERVVVYHSGVVPDRESERSGAIDVMLSAKGGRERMLRIDRRTGAWQAM